MSGARLLNEESLPEASVFKEKKVWRQSLSSFDKPSMTGDLILDDIINTKLGLEE